MKRDKPVNIQVKQDGKHWAVLAEEQLVTLTVYRKGLKPWKPCSVAFVVTRVGNSSDLH